LIDREDTVALVVAVAFSASEREQTPARFTVKREEFYRHAAESEVVA
jgi:hypothetical protein